MTHRRLFLEATAGVLGAAALSPLVQLDRLLAQTRSELERDLSAADPGSEDFGRRVREEYLLSPEITYLNHASIGTIPRAVHEAHLAYLAVCETNPWLYMWGGAWEEPREAVREKAADSLGCGAGDVALTHNTTEGFNLLAQGLPLGPGDEVLFSSLNHDGASVPFEHHGAARGYRVRRFRFPLDRVPGLTSREIVRLHVEAIRPETRLLVFPHVDNIVGLRHPLAELAAAAREEGVEFVAADGAQTVGSLPLDVGRSGIDFYAASPHKWLQAPKGLGLFFARPDVRGRLEPMWVTWGQERWVGTVRRFEDYGTRDLPAVLALGDALDFQRAIGYETKERRHRHLFERLRELAGTTDGFGWRSPGSWSRAGPLASIAVDGLPATELSTRMLERGYVFRPFRMEGLNAVRLSPNLATSEGELERFFHEGARAIARA